ncbi:type III polyketide synthase [Lacihabitans sp. CCS-44]|uniref:type III polyketide synthase n=1 Tax=Lacihabitans sp. CCS-44 TaxID=2487331 RepID=UPI0020CCA481|nr:type III polyketide synthase [Lacihabitans sp. CCS-44]MCP9754054.1 type III polyketide synthase [Lacihabitans sp. CCS-44]
MSSITHIGTAVPSHKNEQSSIQQFMLRMNDGSPTDKRKMGLMYARSGIETRYSVIPDYSCDASERTFFSKNENLEPFPSIEKRMAKYQETALPLAIKAVENTFGTPKLPEGITHLISVSCTGMSAPGLDVELVQALQISTEIHRTSVNFMGCYAAIHALKQADAICKSDSKAKVLIVLVELCTLHFQKENKLDFITSNLLFGDGAACCLVENSETGMQLEGFYSKLFLENQESMGWHISSHGFLMSLKQEVPTLIEDNIAEFVETSLKKCSFKKNDIQNWAIHPGGRKILDVTAKSLGIDSEAISESYEVLKNYGNMSSCTLLFILEKIKKDKSGCTFVAGFGPGITMESLILKCL